MSYESENKKSEQNENVEDNKNLCTSPKNGQTYDKDENIKDKEKYLNDDMFDEIIPQNDYIKIRTNVINEKMLLDGIKNKKDYTHRDNIIDLFNCTKILFLENKNIIIIQNINLFKNLEELHLDNNLIEELGNLEELENLKMLSCSNNNIKEIKNLDKLINLSELNLHNNQIKKIENLNNNKKLKILILSKNYIENIEDIINLKYLKNLKILNLTDNPISNIQNIEEHIFTNFKNIKYFNNKTVSIQDKINKPSPGFDQICTLDSNNISSDTEQYNKSISEAYLCGIVSLPTTLFDEKEEPSVFRKIKHYLQIKEYFLKDIQTINLKIINKILHLNEERKKSSNAFEKNIENFIFENINRHAQKYTELRKRSKKVISTILSYLNIPKGINNIELIKCPDFYKNKVQLNENTTLSDGLIKKLQNISKTFHCNIMNDVILDMPTTNNKRECEENHEQNNEQNNDEKKGNYILIDHEKYNIIKSYLEKNIEENYLLKDKLITEELMNVVSLNNFIENFKLDISKIIKDINDSISDHFKSLEELDDAFNSKIINFFSEVKNNEHPSIVLSDDEINEYYSYKGKRSNILNNLEDYISSNYNKLGNFLIEEKKKYIFLKSRERILEIGEIIDNFNNLFYSYLCVLHAE
ncbi:leucine-rich repeat protein [Plasmodium vinckei vinckei]|uniref:Leucine-rich repeat protein n=1 Tax=Plasmodium vinckei vinckei TaxID=54757 RepID=A0A449BRS7_PLAVN|nr:leucine-rich repeat protein [Plasmodium vinckei vinckei]KEG01918.1 hypothetical protein YYE_03437 [Plasmodium vinckei vinckei]VEV56125.1 leucine-rich repeat protein [Plasmodium vinckei vinckei]